MNQAKIEVMSAEQLGSAARSRAYAIFNSALEYPDEKMCANASSGQLAEELASVLEAIDSTLLDKLDHSALRDNFDLEVLQVEHTRLFDGSASRSPTPLYGSSYIASRDRAVEEPLRFYDFFGLKLSEASREFPDYIGTQLEFLHYLSYSQIIVNNDQRALDSFIKAEQDFLERHPGHWLPKLALRITKNEPIPFYDQIIRLLNELIQCCQIKRNPAKSMD